MWDLNIPDVPCGRGPGRDRGREFFLSLPLPPFLLLLLLSVAGPRPGRQAARQVGRQPRRRGMDMGMGIH